MVNGSDGRAPEARTASTPKARRTFLTLLGIAIGSGGGAMVGHLIDSMLTDDPYAGWRLGGFLGGLIGGQIGGGSGVVGVAVMVVMVVCSAIGVAVPMIACWLWRPVPMDHWLLVVVTFLGGIAGAFIGLAIGVLALDPRRKRNKSAAEPE